jgi:hypothetical protein
MNISNATATEHLAYEPDTQEKRDATPQDAKRAPPLEMDWQRALFDQAAAGPGEMTGTQAQAAEQNSDVAFAPKNGAAAAGSADANWLAGGGLSRPRPATVSPPAESVLPAAKPTVVRDLSMARDGNRSEVNPAKDQEGFAQKDVRWAGQDDDRTKNVDERTDYLWANDGKKFANVGCTVTALTNGLRIVNPTSNVTPDDAHRQKEPFNKAFSDTRFTDLSGQGKEVKGRWFNDPEIQQIDPVKVDSQEGQEIIDKVKQSLQQGEPVLLGFRNDPSNGQRHSVLAVGASEDGKLRVIDSWDGKVKSLDAAFATINATNPMFDYVYSMRPHDRK